MKQRIINCDILRIIAFFFVICVHSLLHTGFYQEANSGIIMIILNILRCLFIVCVPLFIILTGYLMGEKELNKKYIYKLFKIILTYLLCSITYIVFAKLVLKSSFGIGSILAYNGTPYAWYINLYICLYLIIPFLNILWKNLKSKKQKQYLIIILCILIVLPTFINIHNPSLSWLLNPSAQRSYTKFIPDYFMGQFWPVLYYFIGRYLHEYQLKISKQKNIILLIIFIVLFGIFNFYRNYNTTFIWEIYEEYYSFESLIVAILLANLILHNWKINIKNKSFTKIIEKISGLTLGAYLLSYIFDLTYYSILNKHFLLLKDKLIYFIPIIFAVCISSLLLAYVIDLIQNLLTRFANNLYAKIIANKKEL